MSAPGSGASGARGPAAAPAPAPPTAQSAAPTTPKEQVRRLVLGGAGGAVTRCRDFTAAALAEWGWLPATTPEGRERAEDALLLVSEVVTNACLHADGPEELVLRHSRSADGNEAPDGDRDDGDRDVKGAGKVVGDGPCPGARLRIEVSDANPVPPRPRAPRSPALPGGHGLMVLDRLAVAWGSAAKADGSPGKVVWLEISRPSPPPGPLDHRDRRDRRGDHPGPRRDHSGRRPEHPGRPGRRGAPP